MQSAIYIAGIDGAAVDQYVHVLIGSDGRLGASVVSRRELKTDISPLRDTTRRSGRGEAAGRLTRMQEAIECMSVPDDFKQYFIREIAVPANRSMTRG